jgi:hypothetical protein
MTECRGSRCRDGEAWREQAERFPHIEHAHVQKNACGATRRINHSDFTEARSEAAQARRSPVRDR